MQASDSKREKRRGHIAVIDDDESLNRSLVLHLEERGFRVSAFTNGRTALDGASVDPPDLALLDIRLKDMDGLDVLRELRQSCPDTSVVMITAFHETELTVEAMRLGALDYLPKPLDLDQVNQIIDQARARRIETRRALKVPLAAPPDDASARWRLVGTSSVMLDVFKSMGEVAASSATVLLIGESGTGKELVARTIHAHSQRSGPFLSVNCAMLTPEFLASELFGHEKGAFTGATERRRGTFELAHGGTLFLDEGSEIDPAVQARLLRVLQEQEFQRLGGNETISVDVRLIVATNRDLADMVAQGTFREDLYFRLAVVPIRLPSLQERKEDIPPLVEHILRTKVGTGEGAPPQISPDAMRRLVEHEWRGNVRELENVVVRAALHARAPVVLAEDLGLSLSGTPVPPQTADLRSLEDVEKDHILSVLQHTHGNKTHAARILGISRPTLDNKLKRYDVKIERKVTDS